MNSANELRLFPKTVIYHEINILQAIKHIYFESISARKLQDSTHKTELLPEKNRAIEILVPHYAHFIRPRVPRTLILHGVPVTHTSTALHRSNSNRNLF